MQKLVEKQLGGRPSSPFRLVECHPKACVFQNILLHQVVSTKSAVEGWLWRHNDELELPGHDMMLQA